MKNYYVDDNGKFLCIIDDGQGVSVTNCIDKLVKQIAKEIDILALNVIYQDTEGTWNSYNIKEDSFPFVSIESKNEIMRLVLESGGF